jgi:hypothetical protein
LRTGINSGVCFGGCYETTCSKFEDMR